MASKKLHGGSVFGSIREEISIMKNVILFMGTVFFLLTIHFTAWGGGPTIRMGYLQSDIHHLPAWVALEKGFYEQEGIEVKVAGIFKAGPEEMSAFAAGALDIGYVGEAPATTAVANHAADVQVVAQVNTEGSAVVVGKALGIQRVSDLVGKHIAIPGHSTVQDFLIKKMLAGAGLPVEKVKIIVIKPPEMIPALRGNQIDAFIAWEPYPAKAATSSVGRTLISSGEIWEDHPCCVLVVDSLFLKKRRDEVKGVVRAHVKATDFIGANLEEAVRIGVKYTGMDADTVALALKNVKHTYQISVEGEKEYVDFLSRLGYIKINDPGAFVNRFLNGDILAEMTSQ
jgi:NitT/TauT family transport system substrate-binding protein